MNTGVPVPPPMWRRSAPRGSVHDLARLAAYVRVGDRVDGHLALGGAFIQGAGIRGFAMPEPVPVLREAIASARPGPATPQKPASSAVGQTSVAVLSVLPAAARSLLGSTRAPLNQAVIRHSAVGLPSL